MPLWLLVTSLLSAGAANQQDSYQVRLESAVLLYAEQRFAEASVELQDLIASYPTEKDAYLWLGHSRVGLRDWPAALNAYEQYTALAPPDVVGLRTIARTYETAGNKELAAEWYRKALELEPQNAQLRQALDRVTSDGATVPPTSPSAPSAGTVATAQHVPTDRSTGSSASGWTFADIAKWAGVGLLVLAASFLIRSMVSFLTMQAPYIGILIGTVLLVGNRTRYGLAVPEIIGPFNQDLALRWAGLFCVGSVLSGVMFGLLLRRAGVSLPTVGEQTTLPVVPPARAPSAAALTMGDVAALTLERKRAAGVFNAAQRNHQTFARAVGIDVGTCGWDLDESVRSRARMDDGLQKAERGYLKALDESDRPGVPVNLASAQFALGCLYHLQGRMEEAAEQFRSCLHTIGQLPRLDALGLQLAGWAALDLGVMAARRGDRQAAEPFLWQALDIFASAENPDGSAAASQELSRLAK